MSDRIREAGVRARADMERRDTLRGTIPMELRARNYERCEERFAAHQARGVIPLHALNAWLNLEGFE